MHKRQDGAISMWKLVILGIGVQVILAAGLALAAGI